MTGGQPKERRGARFARRRASPGMPAHSTRDARSQRTLDLLEVFESPNVTFRAADGSWPIVWERARGVHVWDEAGRQYCDLTAAFGVANAGHANPGVVRAARRQMSRLVHAMGDVHPHAVKAELARELSRVTFERWSESRRRSTRASPMRGKVIFGNSGFEAVEAALKTALLATHRPGVVAFEGAYHGLGYGALNATHRGLFRSPFRRQLCEFAAFAPFPQSDRELAACEAIVRRWLRSGRIGAVLVEPIQGRGGIRVPTDGFLGLLRRLCDEHAALLLVDEIYTGFGRTGRWFACEHEAVVPDLICLGKALTGGFPLSACVGRADLMDAAWPRSTGEAIHTSTFLGHPVGCAMALAQIREIERLGLVDRSARLGAWLRDQLARLRIPGATLNATARGRGLMVGLDLRDAEGRPATDVVLDLLKRLLRRGFIFLPEGAEGNVISFTPPLTITRRQLTSALGALEAALGEVMCG